MKLKNKLTLLYIFSVFIPMVATNGLFYHVITQNVKQQKLHDASLVIKQMKNDWQQNIEQVVGISTLLYMDNQINEMLDRQYGSEAEYVQFYNEILPEFNKYRYMYPLIRSITFFTDNPTVMFSMQVQPLTDEIQRADWYQQMNSLPDIIHIDGSFAIVRKLNYFTIYNKTERFVKIELDQNAINHLFRNETFPGDIYLVNGQGMIEYTTNPSIRWQTEMVPFASQAQNEQLIVEEEYEGNYYFRHWKVIGVISAEKAFKEIRYSKKFIFYLTSLNLIVPSFIIFAISRSLHTRIAQVLKYMKKMENEQFETIRTGIYRDEIGQLASEFNRMSYKIKKLIQDVYMTSLQKKELELQKKQAQLDALQSQINPHFLFNVLETIRMRSVIKHEYETAEMIENMAKILRKSISWGKDWVTVREEIDVVSRLLHLQKYRFGEKICYDIKVDPSLLEQKIPNMVILTFVENACKHGMESQKGQGRIDVQVEKEKERMKVMIRDNGPGIDERKLRQLFDSLEREEKIGENVGIKNVYYRLKMCYGNRFGFHIHNEHGTVVTLLLPSENMSGHE
ncbi:two-component system sensor histidine kinase YesM [Anoxybacillus tepidamans]|uniref:histidine kinase n=1 Tax=Anoxybacteroides tepidamans TaxID=265948 RepID=A0A7W8IUZ5_9BACL|nr:sensor histidine kinase [Anoxybacillus tepidamans]MBB5326356.1 two-component system sensor histidine kinase YesM [Anoxybacillus tepidamans]